jgi:hypothetical protein
LRRPDFKQAMNELSILRQQLARLDQDETRMNTTPTASDYVSKFREFKYQETLFELFTKQYELAKLHWIGCKTGTAGGGVLRRTGVRTNSSRAKSQLPK